MIASDFDETTVFQPRFGADGLIPAIVTDATDGTVLMFAHMNAEALRLTLETGIAHFWSRSRGKLWKKGESSGEVQKLIEMRTDCDQDVVLMLVEQTGRGAACHTGRKTCFYRRLSDGVLEDTGEPKLFDPKIVYGS